MMTIYERSLIDAVTALHPGLSSRATIEKLIEMGVVDFSRCKILAVREHVLGLMKKGMKKIDAMWEAADTFSCSYEYIRKCMYYYRDINM